MTTDTVELPESARRFHEMYRSDLSRVEPVSDAQILAAIDRGETHDRNQIPDAARWDIAAHLGFVHDSWTTRRLRPQIDALKSAGRIRDVRRPGLDLVALTSTGRRTLRRARSAGQVSLPESPLPRLPDPPATDLLPIRHSLLPFRSQEAGESPQKQAKRPTPVPRVFGGFRPSLLAFAKH
jgi:hypothetical protein